MKNGRPRLGTTNPTSIVIALRLTTSMRDSIREIKGTLTTSEFIRLAIQAKIEDKKSGKNI